MTHEWLTPAFAKRDDTAEQGMPRSKLTLTAASLIVAFAMELACAPVVSAESWFGWRKSAKNDSGNEDSARQPSATKPVTKSNATTPSIANRRQAAPVSAGAVEEAAPKHWWNRIGGGSHKDDQQARAREKGSAKEKVPVVVKKSLPPPPDKKLAFRKPIKPAIPDAKADDGWLDDRAFVTLSGPESDDVVARTEVPGRSRIVRPAGHAGLQPKLLEPARRKPTPSVRYVAHDDDFDAVDGPPDTGGAQLVPNLPPLRQQTLPDLRQQALPDLRQDAATKKALLPFTEADKSAKIQIRKSPTSAEMISLTVRDAPLSVVLSLIAEQHGLNLVAGGEVEGRVTVTLNDVALDEALNALLTVNGYSWHRSKNILIVSKVASESRSSPELRGVVVRNFRLNYIAADDVDKVVQSLLSPAGQSITTIIDSKNTRRTREEIVIQDLPEYVERIAAYIADVDRPPRQVLIEAHVLQINLKDDCRHGVNLKEIFDINNTKISLETTGFANPKANPAFFFGIDNANFHSLLEALKVSTDAKTLATPQVLCLNGQHAKIQIGQQLGFLVTTTTQTSTLQNVNFLDVGVVLDVTPTITDEGLVMMLVKPEVSGGNISPAGLPQEDTTEVETTVMLADGQGMIIGGLIKEEDTEVQTKIPYLGDLWLVGRLFQRRSVVRQRIEVIIALVPYIVPHPDDKPAGMDAKMERARSRLLGPPLERMDRRHWEPDPSDAIRNPKHLFSGEIRQRIHDPYSFGNPPYAVEKQCPVENE